MIGQPILSLIKFFYTLFGNYGLAIILLTLIIKLVLLPLTKTSYTSMKAMQDLQPEIASLRERVKDPSQLNQELMGLYKKKGVNPMGGCLPMVLQFPVFLGMFNALQNSIDLRHAPFALWVNDLSVPEALPLFGYSIPFMILLMGATMFLQQLTMPSAGDPAQKKMMLFMPVIFTGMFLIYPFPSGLVLYWLINNIISILQQKFMTGGKKYNVFQITIISSLVIFFLAFILTLI
ncbi:UNVERIFIED_CONTAM: hypothetical protein GTU68_047168 [Idotea baltica]|nr:hypothetical protein [Idotea baltica]